MTKMAKVLLMFVAAFALAGSAAASDTWVDGGAKEFYGTHDYNGVNAYGELGVEDWSVKPMFSTFHNSLSTGTYNTYSLRVGYDTKLIGLGVTAGATPSVNGYNNKFAGADATLSISPSGEGARERINGRQQASGPAQGQGLARIDIGAAATYTEHTDHFTADKVSRIGQGDLTGSVGVSFLRSLLSVDITKSVYDHDPDAYGAGIGGPRAPRVESILGQVNSVQAFPNVSTNVKLFFSLMPLIKPYAGYTHTTFKQNVGDSNTYTFGLDVELAMLEVSAGYEHFVQNGFTSQNFVSVGANLRF